jgi:hypothetical protein
VPKDGAQSQASNPDVLLFLQPHEAVECTENLLPNHFIGPFHRETQAPFSNFIKKKRRRDSEDFL